AAAAHTGRRRVLAWFARGLATSAWVAITTAPITALHFHQVAAGGVVGNLLLTPVVELAALPLGLAGSALGDAGAPIVTLATWHVGLFVVAGGVLARGIPVGTIAIGSSLVAAALVATSLWLATRQRRGRSEVAAWLALCLLWAVA